MNDDIQEKLLEEMNRRSYNSRERERRRRRVRTERILMTVILSLLLISICVALIYNGFFREKDGDTSSKISVSEKSLDGNGAESDNSLDVNEGKDKIQEDKASQDLMDISHGEGDAVMRADGTPDGDPDETYDGDPDETHDSNSDETLSGSSEGLTTEEENPDDFEINLTFAGDCCLSSNLEDRSEGSMLWYIYNYPSTYFFEKVKPFFENDDLTIVNCECAISDRAVGARDKGDDSGYWFKAPTRAANAFVDGSVEAVSLSNNHANDYGEECMQDTKNALDDVDIQWGLRDNIIYYEKNGFTIAIVCVSFYSYYEVGVYCLPYLTEAVQNSDYQIVFFHGGTEGIYTPNDWKVQGCHAMIDAGADLVIGSHPHVLQPKETYNGVDIIYSLGNFCFGGNNNPENRTLIYKYKLNLHRQDSGIELVGSEDEMIPCYVYTGDRNNWQPAPIEDGETAARVIQFMNGELSSPN